MAVRCTFAVVLALAAAVAPAFADKLDAESRKWLETVGAIILPQEANTYGQLKGRAEGATAVIRLVRAEAAGLSARDPEGKRAGALVIVAHAIGEDGRIGAVDERSVAAPVQDEEAILESYRLFLRPGRYTLHSGSNRRSQAELRRFGPPSACGAGDRSNV